MKRHFLFLFLWVASALVYAQKGGLIPVEKNGRYGYVNSRGKLVLDTAYEKADFFHEGLALVQKDGMKLYIDISGSTKIGPLSCASASAFSEGLARITGNSGEKYYIDQTGKKVLDVPPEFYDAQLFHEGLALVSVQTEEKEGKEEVEIYKYKNKKEGPVITARPKGQTTVIYRFGYMDRNGQLVIPCRFVDADNFFKGVARVKEGNRFGLIDKSGKYTVKPKYEYIHPFNSDIIRVEAGGLSGYINTAGKVLIKPKYSFATNFSEGMAAALIKDKIGFIDIKGKTVIAPEYDYAEPFSEGYAVVMANKKWGFIDAQGRKFIPLTLDEAQGFSEGMAAFKKRGRWGFMDKTGKVVIPPEFDGVSAFSDGLAEVQYLRFIFYINKEGKPVPLKD